MPKTGWKCEKLDREGGCANIMFGKLFPKKRMKMKETGPGGRVSLAPPAPGSASDFLTIPPMKARKISRHGRSVQERFLSGLSSSHACFTFLPISTDFSPSLPLFFFPPPGIVSRTGYIVWKIEIINYSVPVLFIVDYFYLPTSRSMHSSRMRTVRNSSRLLGGGVSAPGGGCLVAGGGVGIPACTEADPPPPWTKWQTGVKT